MYTCGNVLYKSVGELPTVTPEGAIALNVWANDTVAIVNGGHTFSGSSDNSSNLRGYRIFKF